MIHTAIFLLLLGAFISLLLAMPRHQQDWLRRKLGAQVRKTVRRSGFLLFALAFIIAGIGLGWSYGAVVWFGCLSAAAATVVIVDLNRERLLRFAAKVRS